MFHFVYHVMAGADHTSILKVNILKEKITQKYK